MHFDSQLWGQVKTNLKSRNQNNKLLDTWLAPVEHLSTDDTGPTSRLCLGVPSELHRYWISNNFLNQICSEITAIYTRPFQIELSVTGQNQQSAPDSPNALEEAMVAATKPVNLPPQNQTLTPSFTPPKFLREDHTFETFVVGRNNEFAHAASYNVARNPGAEGYNPLFICGPVGMGKTHLLHAVGNEIRKNSPHLRINYLTAETFLNECVSSIRRNEMEKFKARYREKSDVLLVDDIQFLKGESTQDEFFHTLNHFFAQKKQVVVASDRMPKDITGLEDRIRSRLEWGLIADIQMPDIETRLAILRYKAERLNIRIQEDVINYIARISKRSIRELEGNLNKFKMYCELQGLQPSLENAKKVLAIHDHQTVITLEEIQKLVCEKFQIKLVDIKSASRTKTLVVPRQMAMYLIKKVLDKSLVDIGRAFGGRDHTTVLNAIARVTSLQQTDLDFRKDYEELLGRINTITGV